MQSVTVEQLSHLNSASPVELIDVRTPAEYREVHATPARNVPLDRLDPAELMTQRQGNPQSPIYFICQGGNRSIKAVESFLSAGFENVVNVEGGTNAWQSSGLPVVRGKKTISIERQVRILAGFIVLVSSLLAIFVHPFFAGISAFVGAGLMFAGITDTCGMGMMLAKMPWNQVKPDSSNLSTEQSCSV